METTQSASEPNIAKFITIFALVFACVSAYALPSYAANVTREQMNLQLDLMADIFEVRYAPLEWKKSLFGWDLQQEIRRVKEYIADAPDLTVKQFQQALRSIFLSGKDYHLDINFYSTESAQLPFKIKPVSGKCLISYIDPTLPQDQLLPFEVGDELLSFDGLQASDALANFLKLQRGCNRETDNLFAAEMMTYRRGLYGHEVPVHDVEVVWRSAKDESVSKCLLKWKYVPEYIPNPLLESASISAGLKSAYDHQMMLPQFSQEEFDSSSRPYDYDALSARESYVPMLGRTWWVSDKECPFHAYLFELPSKRNAGYIRIPHFRGSAYHVDQFRQLMRYFEEFADVLVIDQVNNPGGSPRYLYALLTLLTSDPLAVPEHKLSLTHFEVAMAASNIPLLRNVKSDADAKDAIGTTFDGYPVNCTTAEGLLRYFEFILSEWNAGKTITDPFPLYGINFIMPCPEGQYTKPLLVLTNGMDFSGADFFPAILQDNRRAVILGTRTAGAGGMFTSASHHNPFGIRAYHMTVSLAERTNGLPLENFGVEPDIPYQLTERDIRCNYEEYKLNIINALENLANGRAATH